MGKRILALLLAGILFVAMVPSGLSAAETSGTGQDMENSDEWIPPAGGMEESKMIEITTEEARKLGISEEEIREEPQEGEINTLVRGSQKYDASWDIYSSNYIYNRLSQKEKKFWDAMDDCCRKYLTESKDAKKYAIEDKNGNLYWCYIMQPVSYPAKELTLDRILDLKLMFVYANPQYYFLDSSTFFSKGTMWFSIYDEFAKGKNRKASTGKMKKVIDTMEEEIAKGKSDIEKVRIAHDLLIRHVKYDYLYCTPLEKSPYHQSAYSAFCYGYTVCAGYAKAFDMLVNGAGIESLAVGGSGHAWNIVCLNNSWRHIDCTWDDRDGLRGTEMVYRYFNRSTDMLNQLDQTGTHKISPVYRNYIPKCIWDSGATDTGIGTYEESFAEAEKPKILQKKVSGGILVTIRTADPGAEIYYTLDGKKPSASFARCHLYQKPFKVSAPVTVKAVAVCDGKENSKITTVKINGKVYKVKFDSRGGSKVKTQKVFAGARVKKPSAPKRRQYKFAGWYQDKKCKKKWDFKKKVTKNIVLYAGWK